MTADGFVHGAITILSDDVLFEPLPESPSEDVDGDLRPLHQILMQDEAFVRDLADPAFAAALYGVFENDEFEGPVGAMRFAFGQRCAARFVASLRGGGEVYLDYAWGRGSEFAPADIERARAHLSRFGVRAM